MGNFCFCTLGIGLIATATGKSIYSSTSGHATDLFSKPFKFFTTQEQQSLWMEKRMFHSCDPKLSEERTFTEL